MGCEANDVVLGLRAMGRAMAEYRDELVELDRAIGDGDHGENMKRGFDEVVSALDATTPETPAAALKLAATTLISKVGGAAGPLYGTAFLRAASALGDVTVIDEDTLARALRAAADGVVERGKAAEGDATMVDALLPAVTAAEQARASGTAVMLQRAAEAAEEGAGGTAERVPRRGRASYLGERAVGHVDPGARSTALLLRALATAAR